MFFNRKTSQEPSVADSVMLVLQQAGVDLHDKDEIKWGMIAYNTALTISPENRVTALLAGDEKIGRNDPCLCGSGKKYKKCCLDKKQGMQATDAFSASTGLDARLLPRLWDMKGMYEDFRLLADIMKEDAELAKICFSPEKTAAFMEKIRVKEGLPDFDNDPDADAKIDDLAFRYARESGENKIYQGIRKKFLAAAQRTSSIDGKRALAMGVFFGIVADSNQDPQANLLNTLLFRKALGNIARKSVLYEKIYAEFGDDSSVFKNLRDKSDPAAWKMMEERIKKLAENMTEEERTALEEASDKRFDALWDLIEDKHFPVALPLAMQMAIMMLLPERSGEMTEAYAKEVYRIIEDFSENLFDEDCLLYEKLLNRWLDKNPDADMAITEAVETMLGVCHTRHLGDYVIELFFRCGSQKLYFPLDDEERSYIEMMEQNDDFSSIVTTYADWIDSKGYAKIAQRLRDIHQQQQSMAA